jgi:hypothetical protein
MIHDALVRRASPVVAALTCLLGASLAGTSAASASSTAVSTCAAASVKVTDYNTVVGAGNVNDLFWIKNVSGQECSLRGYPRVTFFGVYGDKFSAKNARTLVVGEERTLGRDGNDLGGVKLGVAIPKVVLPPHGGRASFWIYGTDEPHNNPPTRCITSYEMSAWLPGDSAPIVVAPMRGNGFFWCGAISVHPIVPGDSGSLPPMPLSYFFGAPG